MFCPKCGGQNPETGKYCRSCGTDLGNVTSALSGIRPIQPLHPMQPILLNHKGKPIHWESAITKIFTGIAFLAVAIALAFTRMGSGWWFWLLIPAFGSIGSGVAQYIQLKKSEKFQQPVMPQQQNSFGTAPPSQNPLPPSRADYVDPESRYKTGDLVPPSVTDNTTRHLEFDSEGQTMTLPKK